MLDVNKYDKEFHYNNARSLLEKDDLSSIRYACLELRYVIEAHVYQQLLASADEVPRTIIETWQPNKAIKLLSEFDDLADKDLHVSIVGEDGELKSEITYKNIPIKDLNKLYNSLGSYLHLPMPKKLCGYKIDKDKVIKIFDQLSKIIAGNLIVIKRDYEYFQCQACGQNILYTNHYLESNESITCQNDACCIEHAIKKSGDSVSFSAKHIFDCGVCNKEISVFFSKIEYGYKFRCEHCDTEYTFEMTLRGIPPDQQS